MGIRKAKKRTKSPGKGYTAKESANFIKRKYGGQKVFDGMNANTGRISTRPAKKKVINGS